MLPPAAEHSLPWSQPRTERSVPSVWLGNRVSSPGFRHQRRRSEEQHAGCSHRNCDLRQRQHRPRNSSPWHGESSRLAHRISTANPYIPAGSYNIVARYSGDEAPILPSAPAIALTIGKGSEATEYFLCQQHFIFMVWIHHHHGGCRQLSRCTSHWNHHADCQWEHACHHHRLHPARSIRRYSWHSHHPGQPARGPAPTSSPRRIAETVTTTSSSATMTVTVTSTPPVGFTLGNGGNIAITPGQFAGTFYNHRRSRRRLYGTGQSCLRHHNFAGRR